MNIKKGKDLLIDTNNFTAFVRRLQRMARKRIFRRVFSFHGFFESVQIAIKGIAYLFLYHRNMRIIFLCGAAAIVMGIVVRLSAIEAVILSITIALVFVAEMFNTAIELMINMFTRKYYTLIKLVKDIAAAVVLITALNAVAVGIILFGRRIFFKV
jgi:diacylglycerol kinase